MSLNHVDSKVFNPFYSFFSHLRYTWCVGRGRGQTEGNDSERPKGSSQNPGSNTSFKGEFRLELDDETTGPVIFPFLIKI